jgi:hypothetical protein
MDFKSPTDRKGRGESDVTGHEAQSTHILYGLHFSDLGRLEDVQPRPAERVYFQMRVEDSRSSVGSRRVSDTSCGGCHSIICAGCRIVLFQLVSKTSDE